MRSIARSRRKPTCRSPRRWGLAGRGRSDQRGGEGAAPLPAGESLPSRDKLENYTSVDAVFDELIATIPEEETERRSTAKSIFHELKEKVLRDEVLQRSVRLDGRKFDEIRPIWSEAGVLPRTHGSAVFTRGETQALVTVTLGTSDDQQKIETVEGEQYRRFMLH